MEGKGEPVLRIGAGDFTAMVRAGQALVCLHNQIVAVAVPLNPVVTFERGATDDQIRKAYNDANHDPA